MSETEADLRRKIDDLERAVEQAYGCLWRSLDLDAKSCHARKILLDQIDRDGQRRGIKYAQDKFGVVSDFEALQHLP